MKKKKIAFLFGFTENLAFAAANAALGINRYISINDYDIVMYYTNLPETDIIAFKKIPHVKLKKFNLEKSFINTMLTELPEKCRFKSINHLMCFAHFEAFSLLDEYENVVWNDVDIGVQGDISTILNYIPLGLTPDIPWNVKDQFTQDIKGFDMSKPAYCSGVMLVNDKLPYKKIYKWLYEKAILYAKYLMNPDQAIINLMLQEFDIMPKEIPLLEYNCISWNDKANVAKIVHFGTEQKVWNNTNICNSFPEWYRTHLYWLSLGGSDFDQSKITPRNPRGALDYLDKLSLSENTKFSKKWKIYIFGFIPFLKIRKTLKSLKIYLFFFIPIFKSKEK